MKNILAEDHNLILFCLLEICINSLPCLGHKIGKIERQKKPDTDHT